MLKFGEQSFWDVMIGNDIWLRHTYYEEVYLLYWQSKHNIGRDFCNSHWLKYKECLKKYECYKHVFALTGYKILVINHEYLPWGDSMSNTTSRFFGQMLKSELN